MPFEQSLKSAWAEHTGRLSHVVEGMNGLRSELSRAEQIPSFLTLLSHLLCDHGQDWSWGSSQLQALNALSFSSEEPAASALRRLDFLCRLGLKESLDWSALSLSERTRIEASWLGALVARNQDQEALSLSQSLPTALTQLEGQDPAVKAVAMNANNAAFGLRKKGPSSQEQKDLLLSLARLARQAWGQAGTWLEIERAEYLLSLCWSTLGDSGRGLLHARRALSLCEQNQAEALEFFFIQEAFAQAHLADNDLDSAKRACKLMKAHLEKLTPEDLDFCKSTLKEIETRLEVGK